MGLGSRLLAILCLVLSSLASAQSKGCAPAVVDFLNPYTRAMVRFSELKQLRVMTWNVRNLYTTVGRYERQVTGMVKLTDKRAPLKSWESMRGLQNTIRSADPDVLVLQEVESQISVHNFVYTSLADEYRVFFAPGNDPRGIGIAFLVRKNLNLTFELRINAHEMWVDPAKKSGLEPVPVFARDFPVLIARNPNPIEHNNPVFAIAGVHFKAMNSRPGDPNSEAWVKAEAERATVIVNRLRKEFGDSLPLLVAGDFNRDPADHQAIRALIADAGLVDSLDLAGVAPHSDSRTTFTVHSHSATGKPEVKKLQLDGVFMSRSLQEAFVESGVPPLRDPKNLELPVPETKAQRESYASDHRPVLLVLDVVRMLESGGHLPAP